MLTPEEAAEWQGISVNALMKKHRAGILPGFKSGNKTLRWHPRSLLALQARRARIPDEVIAASFGGAHD
jgi:hypothetical protein